MIELFNSLVNLIPEKYRPLVAFGAAASPFLTRAFHAVMNGGGLRGIIGAIWFGTNTPKQDAAGTPVKISVAGAPTNPPAGPFLVLLLSGLVTLALLTGCAVTNANRAAYNLENDAADLTQGTRHTFNVWYAPERAAAVQSGDTNRVAALDGMRDYVRLQVKQVGVALQTVDNLRLELATNSASTNFTALKIAEDALPMCSSNLTWAVKYFMSGRLSVVRKPN